MTKTAMNHDPFAHLPNEQMTQLANVLGNLRDSWVMISLALKDLMAEAPSPERDKILTEVERCLCRMREVHGRDFD
jgi:hypothetical protein